MTTDSLSRMRMTTDSPCTLGRVTTRRSTWWPSMLSPMRPSCGTRRSAMSSSAMTLMRLTTPATIARGTTCASFSTPSMRRRTRIESISGSRWMSDAPCSTAWAMIWFASLMIGASSTVSRRSTTSAWENSCSGPSTRSGTTSSMRPRRPMRACRSSRLATAGRISMPVMIAMSSIATTFAGSAMATSSVRSPR